MIQKHFMDIENLVEKPTELRDSNACGFHPGEEIQISEKIDGSNACVAYDSQNGALCAFSRKRELSPDNSLRGFFNYVQTLNKDAFASHPSYRVFGEWLVPHKIRYLPEHTNEWYVYDIYDAEKEEWLPQSTVREFCSTANLNYIHVLYEGPFISWDHCRSFSHNPGYGPDQEGVVVKSQERLDNESSRVPFYLKIVNDEFREKMLHRAPDPEKEKEKDEALALAELIITKERVEKELYKMIDEGILPEKLSVLDMKTVAAHLPKRVYDDCVKEDAGVVEAIGNLFGKTCSALSMKYAKMLILSEREFAEHDEEER